MPKISVQRTDHQEIAYAAAKKSLILSGAIPKPLAPSSVLIIASGVEAEKRQIDDLQRFFSSVFQDIKISILTDNASVTGIELGRNPLIVILHRPRGALTEEQGSGSSVHNIIKEVVDILKRTNTHPAGVVSLGDPYIIAEFAGTTPDFLLRSYSDSNPSVRMMLKLLEQYI